GNVARKRRNGSANNWIRAQEALVGTLDAEKLPSNKAYRPAKPDNRASKFEGGIRRTNLDAGSSADEATIRISLRAVDADPLASQPRRGPRSPTIPAGSSLRSATQLAQPEVTTLHAAKVVGTPSDKGGAA